jgi:hypothetical protein
MLLSMATIVCWLDVVCSERGRRILRRGIGGCGADGEGLLDVEVDDVLCMMRVCGLNG